MRTGKPRISDASALEALRCHHNHGIGAKESQAIPRALWAKSRAAHWTFGQRDHGTAPPLRQRGLAKDSAGTRRCPQDLPGDRSLQKPWQVCFGIPCSLVKCHFCLSNFTCIPPFEMCFIVFLLFLSGVSYGVLRSTRPRHLLSSSRSYFAVFVLTTVRQRRLCQSKCVVTIPCRMVRKCKFWCLGFRPVWTQEHRTFPLWVWLA